MTRIWYYFLQDYGKVLSKLKCGDTLGVFVTTKGELHFTINEVDQGIAWNTLPMDHPLYVVINLGSRPTQISTLDRSAMRIMSKFPNRSNEDSGRVGWVGASSFLPAAGLCEETGEERGVGCGKKEVVVLLFKGFPNRVLVYPDRGSTYCWYARKKLWQCWWMWVSAKEKRDVESAKAKGREHGSCC